MEESILTSIKAVLGLPPDIGEVFEQDVLMQINSAISTLTQIGVGPEAGFLVEDSSAKWVDFLGTDPRFNSAKTLMYLMVRLAFDPPATSFHITAMQEQIEELKWRLNVTREETKWVDPESGSPDPLTPVIPSIVDGGSP